MITFIVKPHTIRAGEEMVEVHRDGELVASIYGGEESVRVFSKYIKSIFIGTAVPQLVEMNLKQPE